MFPMVGTTLASARTNFLFLLLLIYPQSWMVGIIIDVNMANVATCPQSRPSRWLPGGGWCLQQCCVRDFKLQFTENYFSFLFHYYYVASASTIACGLRNDDIVSVGHNMGPGQMAWSMIHYVPIKLN